MKTEILKSITMSTNISRRNFLRLSALGGTAMLLPSGANALEAPLFAPAKGKKGSANDIINIGFIGLGQQAIHLMNGFITIPDVRIVAGCDIYDIKRDRFEQRVKKYYEDKKIKNKFTMYTRYEELLARPDIDAVVIATPDHQHALMAIAACKAKKDIYLEKPLTFTIYEGQQLVKAVRENNIILQVGSMQRSSAEFIHAANVVREGRLGRYRSSKLT
jgi:predicted dehydrogenase